MHLKHLTITENIAAYAGGGIFAWGDANALLDHCAVVRNTAGGAYDDVHVGRLDAGPEASYLETEYNAFSVQPVLTNGGAIGSGYVIVTEPGFVDATNGDLRILAGDVHPVTRQYTSNTDPLKVVATSPCIDAGGDADVPGGSWDIGAHEFARVMPIGNSNTAYDRYTSVLRLSLFKALNVGINPSYTNPSLFEWHLNKYIRGCVAAPGQTNHQILQMLNSYVLNSGGGTTIMPTDFAAPEPHLAIIMAGTNNIRLLTGVVEGPPLAPPSPAWTEVRRALDTLHMLVDAVRNKYPSAEILVGSLTPFRFRGSGDISADAGANRFDLAYSFEVPIADGSPYFGVRGLVSSLRDAGDTHVRFVDISRLLSSAPTPDVDIRRTPNDPLLADEVHFNPVGGRVVAQEFYRAISEAGPGDPNRVGWGWAW